MSNGVGEQLENLEEVTLHAVKIAVNKWLGGYALDRLKVCAERCEFTDEIVMTLHAFVMTESIKEATEECTFSYPASWWQHFKAQCFPNWLARAFPPRMLTERRTVHFDAREYYPKFPSMYPDRAEGSFTRIGTKQFGRSRYDEVSECESVETDGEI